MSDRDSLSAIGHERPIELDWTGVLSGIECMLIECKRCGQGYVRAMLVRATETPLWVCDECDATWTSRAEVNICKFIDYGTLMASVGLSGSWSELEPQ